MQITKINNNYVTNNSYTANNNYKIGNNVNFKKILADRIPQKVLKNNRYLLVISGPSGVGKDTVMEKLSNKFTKIVTYATRNPRKGEVDGINYFFTGIKEFEDGIKNNEFVEYVKSFSGNYYGTKKETINNSLAKGDKPFLVIDTDGEKSIKQNLKDTDVISIFLQPPSLKVLKERLLKRGTESKEQIQERLDRSLSEIKQAGRYDAEVQVNNPEEAANDILKLLNIH